MVGRVRGRDNMHGPAELHGLVEPSRHLLGTRVPVRRYISIVAGNSDQPWSTLGRKMGEWIGACDMKLDARQPAVRFHQMERQQRGHRAAAFTSDHVAEAARGRKRKADGVMNLESGMDVHGRAPMREAAGARSWRGGREKMCRGAESDGTGDDHARSRARAAEARRRRINAWQVIIVMGGRYRRRTALRQAHTRPRAGGKATAPAIARAAKRSQRSDRRIPGHRNLAVARSILLDIGKRREWIVEALH